MKFLHALVRYCLDFWSDISVLTVDDYVHRSLRVFYQENEASQVHRETRHCWVSTCSDRNPDGFAAGATSLLCEGVDQSQFLRTASQVDEVVV
jgi:hypothetical protein